jgi:NAD(P)-dependent dehydrogenase (short-subunit alcohol dehydrogenase family)
MRTALISGCSSGFGADLALAFARAGDTVIATMRDTARRDVLDERLRAAGLRAEVTGLDVTDREQIAVTVAGIAARHGRIDVVVNNAGRLVPGPLETLAPADLQAMFDVNLFGAISLTQAVVPLMRKHGNGRVIFVGALGGVVNTPWLGGYCATKHALDSVAAIFDLELRPFGIRASSILPGAFATNLAVGAMTATDPGHEGGGLYGQRFGEFMQGLSRRAAGNTDLGPVIEAVLTAASSPDPEPRYLVAPGREDAVGPLVKFLNDQHRHDARDFA